MKVLPLHLAASQKKTQSLKTLLDSGANPELCDQLGRNTLHLVIANWPSVSSNWIGPHSKFRSIMAIMQQQAEDCLHVLCEHGVNLNARLQSHRQQSALHLAVAHQAPSAIAILASRGASINATDHFGMTPLHMAAGTLQTEITSCLIQQGADVNRVVRQSGNSALHLAVQAATKKFCKTQDTDLSCVEELLVGGASPNVKNAAGCTPLHEACLGGREEVVDRLLQHGADLNKRTHLGENCLFLFLTQTSNLKSTGLLGKLLGLTSPLSVVDAKGNLPHVLKLPRYTTQKDQLVRLAQQPRDLLGICKVHMHQHYNESSRTFLKDRLPEKLYNFVFQQWDCPLDVELNETHETEEFVPLDFAPPLPY
ncbi:ankyrin repeat domain-containing protein 61 [Electrophorus electricus]|uniref:ankyrin repeat domain-containing protein 61 n=1 Tax=Electrophorus electricus TaxID=8005 RepID=UPI0015D0BE62|nr:ankyrin repeat domain-containing protein 61 [Electrophorus electricus]